MGFGLLFIGYILFLNPVNFYFLAPAALVMAFGLRKLSVYNTGFRRAYLINYTLLFGGALSLLLALLENTAYPAFLPSADLCRTVLAVAVFALLLFFYASLFSGISEMAAETGLPKLRVAAVRNCVFSVAYSLFRILLELDFGTGWQTFLSRALFPVLLVGVIIAVLNLLLFYRCYMHICLPEDAAKQDDAPSYMGLLARLKKKNEAEKNQPETKSRKRKK